jgi:hypothetical protein
MSGIVIMKHNRPDNTVPSAAMFDLLTKGKVSRAIEELDNETLRALSEAEVPAQFAQLDAIDLESKR